MVTRVTGRGVAASATIDGAGGSKASYSLVGTCASDHTVRLMASDLTLQGSLSADGAQLTGTGNLGAGAQPWSMRRR